MLFKTVLKYTSILLVFLICYFSILIYSFRSDIRNHFTNGGIPEVVQYLYELHKAHLVPVLLVSISYLLRLAIRWIDITQSTSLVPTDGVSPKTPSLRWVLAGVAVGLGVGVIIGLVIPTINNYLFPTHISDQVPESLREETLKVIMGQDSDTNDFIKRTALPAD